MKTVINTREDLEALKGTKEYDDFMQILKGSMLRKQNIQVYPEGYNQPDYQGEKLFPILYYPNPFETSFNVRLPEIRNFRLTVFDMSGKLVFSNNYVSAKECSVQTETWKSGMYLIKLESDNQLFTSRMVKN